MIDRYDILNEREKSEAVFVVNRASVLLLDTGASHYRPVRFRFPRYLLQLTQKIKGIPIAHTSIMSPDSSPNNNRYKKVEFAPILDTIGASEMTTDGIVSNSVGGVTSTASMWDTETGMCG